MARKTEYLSLKLILSISNNTATTNLGHTFYILCLTDDAWVSGPVRPPQKILLSQKFRHLMGWRNRLKKFFYLALFLRYSCLFTFLGEISKCPPEVRKGSPVKFFEVFYYQNFFQLLTVHKSEDRGVIKMPYDFFVYICDF